MKRREGIGGRPPLFWAENFLLATRDTGYRNSAYSIAEFVDNAVQAGASNIGIELHPSSDTEHPIEILIVDDGEGMDGAALERALAFGGTTRFGDRGSLGRYGMGLPNGALSLARAIALYSWRGPDVLMTRLDLDDLVTRKRRSLPKAEAVARPAFLPDTQHGTAVHLTRCDRLDYRRRSALATRLEVDLGRIYRRFLRGGLKLRVDAKRVRPGDPLFLETRINGVSGVPFGDTLRYQLEDEFGPGSIEVRFSELPVDRWHALPTDEKRKVGITSGHPVSVLRADREIDRGWFFMGGKRRENYDDWWRCEVSFDPTLDELFGITPAKQQVRPRTDLIEMLTRDLEPIARALNGRVRRRFERAKASTPLGAAEEQAARASRSLPALPTRRDDLAYFLRACPDVAEEFAHGSAASPYAIRLADLPSTSVFELLVQGQQLVVLLNERHPLYGRLYGPLAESDSTSDREAAKHVALAVLAAARAEASLAHAADRERLERFRQSWGDVLATFFNA